MFIKPLSTPLSLRKLQALFERTPIDHPARSQIQNDLGRTTVGFKGEESLLYYLEFLNEQQYFIFHNLRLPIRKDKFFQLDYLILSATFFLILEVKNYSGISSISILILIKSFEPIRPRKRKHFLIPFYKLNDKFLIFIIFFNQKRSQRSLLKHS